MMYDRVEVLAAAMSREVRSWTWDAPHMEHERVHLRADAAEVLADIDAADPLRAEGTVCVRLDGLADKIVREVSRHQWDRVTVGRECRCGGSVDGYAMSDHIAKHVESLLQSLAVQ